MVKKLIVMALVICVAAAMFAGCTTPKTSQASQSESEAPAVSEADADTPSAKDEQLKLAVIVITLSNPYYVDMKEGIDQKAKELGVVCDVFGADNESDFQQQIAKFENCANNPEYKAIGVAPMSAVSLVNAISDASKKGKLILNMDDKIDAKALETAGGKLIGFIATDNKLVGQKGAKCLVDKIGTGKVAILEGQSGTWAGEARKQGATEYFKSVRGIELIASQPADWDRNKALDVASNLLQANPDLKGFYCANDTMALGVAQAIKNLGKEGSCFVVGTDGIPEAFEAINAGTLLATVAQDPEKMGAMSVEFMVDAIENNKAATTADPEQMPVESTLVTKENVAKFLK